jgi:hypothetical protein
MKRLLAVVIFVYLLSCNKKQRIITIQKAEDFILVDTSFAPNDYLQPFTDNSYPIYYLGILEDTVRISEQYSIKKPKWKLYDRLITASSATRENLSLFVDTNIKLNAPMQYFTREGIINEDSSKNYHSYLMVLRNKGDSILDLGSSFFLIRTYREVKNRNGNWIELDRLDGGLFCGTGQPDIYLFKNEVLLSKVRRYNGDTLAEFRMVYGFAKRKIYSNVFYDKIDKRFLKIDSLLPPTQRRKAMQGGV